MNKKKLHQLIYIQYVFYIMLKFLQRGTVKFSKGHLNKGKTGINYIKLL